MNDFKNKMNEAIIEYLVKEKKRLEEREVVHKKHITGQNRSIVDLKRRLEEKHSSFKATREMRDHYMELSEVGIGELYYEKNNALVLSDALDKIESIGDGLSKMIATNAKEQYNINKVVHAKEIFK